MNLVEKIQSLADAQNTNFKQIEKSVGLGNGTIRRWEQSSPSVDKLSKVANFLHTTVGNLVDGEKHSVLPKDDQELLTLFHHLTKRNQMKLFGYIERMIDESAEADFAEELPMAK